MSVREERPMLWRSIVRTTCRLTSLVLSLAFLAGCGGQIGDAVSSIASGTPIERPSGSAAEEPTQEPPSSAEEPTQEPPSSEEPPGDSGAAGSAGGAASSGTSTAIWWLLGVVIVVTIAMWLMARRRRRRTSPALQEAYAATAAARDRLALEVSAPSATPGAAEALLDQADQKLRAAQIGVGDQAGRAAVDQALAALGEAREALALRAASAGAAHVSGTDIQARLMRSLGALDAALGAFLPHERR